MDKESKNLRSKKIISVIALIIFITSSTILVKEVVTDYVQESKYRDISEEFDQGVEEVEVPLNGSQGGAEGSTGTGGTISIPRSVMNLQALHLQYQDIVGWIVIPGTPIDYPVVQGRDNDYYLKHTATGQRSDNGAIFVDRANQLNDTNIAIHGHNMGRGKSTMFSTLTKFTDQKFLNNYQFFQFDLLDTPGIWRIFSVMQVDLGGDIPFNYMAQNFLNANDFNNFIDNALAHSVITPGIHPRYGDRLITLSTCDRTRYGDNGRLVVMAVKVN